MTRKVTTRAPRASSAPPALIRAQPPAAKATELMPLLTPDLVRTAAPAAGRAAVEASAARRSPELPAVTTEQRRRLIAQAAYQRALRAGLGTTDPLLDWLSAEREIDAQLAPPATLL